MSELQIVLTYIVGTAWLAAAWFYHKHAVWFLLLWIPIQGWIQLNLFNDSNATVLIYEFQIIGIYLVFAAKAMNEPTRYGPPPAMWLALPFAIWALLLTPWGVTTNGATVTAVGLRTLLMPLPLVWIGYRTFDNAQELKAVSGLLMMQLLLIASVAASQFLGFTPSIRGDFDTPLGSLFVGVIRPHGTFSSSGHLGMYVLFSVLLAVGLLGVGGAAKTKAKVIYTIGLVSATVALIVNTQRAAMVLLAVMLPMVFLLAGKARHIRIGVTIALMLGIGGAIGSQVAGGAFLQRAQSIVGDSAFSLLIAPVERMTDALETPLIGGGLGIASPGLSRVSALLGVPGRRGQLQAKPAESFMASLVYELGVPGLCLFYLFLVAILLNGFRSVRECRHSDLALLAAALFAFQVAIIIQSWTYDPLHYPPSRVLFWVWTGVLLRLPHLAEADPLARQVVRPFVPGHGFGRSPVRSVGGPRTMAARPARNLRSPVTAPQGRRR